MFKCCLLDLISDVDFSGPSYNTSYLAFRNFGDKTENEWKSHPEKIKSVIKAISLCSLADSLETIDIYRSDLEVWKVEGMLKEYGLEKKIKVVQEGGESLNK